MSDPTADPLALAATHYENFPVGSWLVPRAQRRHMHRIYAFARTADDLADEARDPVALAGYREAFTAHLDDPGRAASPLLRDLAASIRALDLPAQLFYDLLDAFALDLEVLRHDRASLFAYCRKSADPVGRLVLRVFGYRDEILDGLSDKICTALQLANHLQDIREDWLERQRIYFPTEDLARHGVAPDDLGGDRAGPGLRALVREWTDETAAMFAAGWPLTRRVRGRLAVELRAILAGAARVLRHLRRIDYDVLATHVRLTRGDKLGVLARALLTTRMPPEFQLPTQQTSPPPPSPSR